MTLLPLSSILIPPDRQRKEFSEDANQELIASIVSKGLFHPLLVRGGTLVAGERRLRAIRDIYDLGGHFSHNGAPVPPGSVPTTQISDLSPLELEEAELEENIRRQDLTWQERSDATARIADLRKRIALDKGGREPTHASLAQEILDTDSVPATQTIRKQLIVAKFKDDADVRGAKTLDDAFKIVKKKERDAQYVRMAANLPPAASRHRLLHCNSLEWMEQADDSQFSIILTDPPYGMGADTFGDSGGLTDGAHFYSDSYEHWQSLMPRFAAESYRLAAPDAHLYCFCDFDRFHELSRYLSAPGWKVHRTPIIWHKPSGQRAPWPQYGPQRKYELILYAIKGNLTTNLLAPDLVSFSPDQNLGHAAQKPTALLLDLLKRSYRPGAKVLDPFMGSGSILPAADSLGLAVTGIEIDERAFGMARQRLDGLKDGSKNA